MHPRDWIEVRPEGVFCKPGGVFIDPMQPVARAIVTHGHADHARAGHGHVYATVETLAIMRARYGEEHAGVEHPIHYGEPFHIDGVTASLHPAGHILGSAQARLEYDGASIVFSGDYKRRHDPTCTPFTPVACDVFVTEATFALPVFRHPPIQDEIARLLASLKQFPERCHLVGVYALGKCQRLMMELRAAGYTETIYLHGAMVRLCELYESLGIDIGAWEVVTPENAATLASKIVLCPPSALADRWSRRLPEVLTAAASGWMRIRARAKQKGVELPLVISDHADWDELTRTLDDVAAPEVWVTHGRDDALVYYAQQHGYRAQALHLLGYEDDAMKGFSQLLERLYFEPSTLGKARLLSDYFRATPDPDRGYAVAIIAGTLSLPNFKRSMVLDLIRERTDSTLFAMSYDYVGEMSETVAHLWPTPDLLHNDPDLPALHEVIATLRHAGKSEVPAYVAGLLDRMTSPERWALLKVGTGSLRIGVSARLLKQVLARYGGQEVETIETLWHGLDPPYEDLFAWLEGRAPIPAVHEKLTFTPVMLAHALEEKDYALITPELYAAEWKYDGIRVQIVNGPAGRALFTRTGDEISASFPDALSHLNFHAVLDGELIVRRGEEHGTFNDLQQRLGRKAPGAKLMETHPAGVILYDVLSLEGEDVRPQPYAARRALLEAALDKYHPQHMSMSPELAWASFADLERLRDSVLSSASIEGLMLKRRDSAYVAGRPTGPWYKWKIDPKLVDAVLMYAQRGSGKRSSFYSDYTFGLWSGDQLLPIGKAYFGFTDAELKELDKWVRHNTVQAFGPVREVKKALVFEVAFDAVFRSSRHKSGFALRFPRISRIRWDKPAAEADRLEVLEALIT